MAGAQRYLLNRSGRFFARLVVPKDLRPIVGKTELRAPLGPDRRTAMKLLPGAVAHLQHQIAQAERKAAPANSPAAPARYPLAPDQIALSHYQQRLAFDDQMRNSPSYAVVSTIGIDDGFVEQLRAGVAGRLSDQELADLMEARIERFRAAGNLDAAPGSDEWRTIARALCSAELEALARVVERDEGDFTGRPSTPLLVNAKLPEGEPEPVSLAKLWNDYVKARTTAGFMKDGGRRQRPVIESLRKFLGHSDARKVTRKDLMSWRDDLLNRISAKTVAGIYLSTIRTLWAWAVENDRLSENVAENVKQAKPKRQRSRDPGYSDKEAIAILKASLAYQPTPDPFGHIREHETTIAAKRWAPILCAFSGARISEILQLRKADVFQEGDRWVMRISPDAGTVKVGDFRDVPIHQQIVALGFLDHVKAAKTGPLFNSSTDPAKSARSAQRQSERLAAWLHEKELVPQGLQPNHAWRHRLKTQARDLGLDMRIVNAIQGHSDKDMSDGYGTVSLTAKARVIDALPDYDLKAT
uniref:tyrosine-type recombinase/integrase n=1 Tax=Paracoccus sp. TRP TaxID=412597 RepID=UPI0002FFB8D8|nr:DUF6538 domain-containing protein [Paracoccus sp. TRP]